MIFEFNLTPKETVRVQLALANYINWLEAQLSAAGSGPDDEQARQYWEARITETIRLHRMFLEPVKSDLMKPPTSDRGVNSELGEGQS